MIVVEGAPKIILGARTQSRKGTLDSASHKDGLPGLDQLRVVCVGTRPRSGPEGLARLTFLHLGLHTARPWPKITPLRC